MTYTSGELPAIDNRIAISADEINQLWADGVPTPDALGLLKQGAGYIRSKRSLDGKWHLKYDPFEFRDDPDTYGLSAEELCDLHDRELAYLRQSGLHVVTYGRVALNGERTITTIAPWMDDIEELPEEAYDRLIKPRLRKYREDWKVQHSANPNTRPYRAVDLTWQFSSSSMASQPFLHDIDPYFSNLVY